VILSAGIGEAPKPGRSIAITRLPAAAKAGSCSSQFTQAPASPWTKTTVRSPSPSSTTLTASAPTRSQRWCSRQSMSSQAERPVGP
jgi:hypothetical protein